MPQLVYRVQKERFVPTLLSGEGARLYGGRWNPVGTPLVYTSASPELAFLETLVHLDGTPLADLPPYVLVTLALPDDSIEAIAAADLPPGWDAKPAPDSVAQFLLPRLQPGSSYLGFALPSAILASPTRNVLLNPGHPLISQVAVLRVEPLPFDERLRPEVPPATPPKRPGRRAARKPSA